jgi:hypothetical protein
MSLYENHIKCSLESMLWALDEAFPDASETRRSAISLEKEAILRDYHTFVRFAATLPRFPEYLYNSIFPKRNRKGELSLRATASDTNQMIDILKLFDAHALAHREGEREVRPWEEESETYRIFPYTFSIQIQPRFQSYLNWFYELRKGEFIAIRMHLPRILQKQIFDKDNGVLGDALFIDGVPHYNFTKSGSFNQSIKLHFSKAFRRDETGITNLLTWRDIPLLGEAELANENPNHTCESVT